MGQFEKVYVRLHFILTNIMILNFSWDFTPLEMGGIGIALLVWIIQIIYQFSLVGRPARFYKRVQSGKMAYLDPAQYPPISVIIYAQNDAENLIRVMPKILNQAYPTFEVIVVVDDSTDDSKDILSSLEIQYKNLYHTYVPDGSRNLSHKKLALTLGVKAAQYDIVAFTNANCAPNSNNWLATLARNFVPGTEIVLGYTADQHPEKKRASFWYCTYDRLLFTLRYLSYALIRRPFMGISSNMAYRKELFFKNKGFSKYLHLHYGDDDLFINEVATRTNTRVEISDEARVTASYDDNYVAWKEQKLQYDFTSEYLRTSAKWVFGFSKLLDYLFAILFVAAIIAGLHNLTLIAITLGMALTLFAVKATFYRQAAKVFGMPRLFFALPLFSLIRPIVNLYFKLLGRASHKKNFTWR